MMALYDGSGQIQADAQALGVHSLCVLCPEEFTEDVRHIDGIYADAVIDDGYNSFSKFGCDGDGYPAAGRRIYASIFKEGRQDEFHARSVYFGEYFGRSAVKRNGNVLFLKRLLDAIQDFACERAHVRMLEFIQ